MASITLRGTRWHVRVRIQGHPTLCKAFHKKADATAWGKSIESAIEGGSFRPAAHAELQAVTLGEALDRYRLTVTPTKRGRVQETNLINLIRKSQESSALCAKRIGDVGQADIARMRDRWLADGLAPATTRNRLACLSHTYVIAAKEWGMAVNNPVTQVRKPQVHNERSRRLFDGEFSRVISATRSEELPAIATLALASAMRLGEIVGLQWARVDLDKRFISLHRTKNGARQVPLSPLALATLRDLPHRDDGRVFGMLTDGASKAWATAVKRARQDYETEAATLGHKVDPAFLVGLHFHDLRHESISRAGDAGFDVFQLSLLSGHRTLSMLKRYTHLNISAVADKLAAMPSQIAVARPALEVA